MHGHHLDNTLRIQALRKQSRDEGIVQPVSKEMEQLSRRLHQHQPSGHPPGGFYKQFQGIRNG